MSEWPARRRLFHRRWEVRFDDGFGRLSFLLHTKQRRTANLTLDAPADLEAHLKPPTGPAIAMGDNHRVNGDRGAWGRLNRFTAEWFNPTPGRYEIRWYGYPDNRDRLVELARARFDWDGTTPMAKYP